MKHQMQVRTLFAVVIAFAALGVTAYAQDAKETTLTGVVSDALCGKKHSMQGMSSADCTRMCVKAGQSYALVVGDKVYNLKGDAPDLDKYAGQKISVKGKLSTDTVGVESVAPAK